MGNQIQRQHIIINCNPSKKLQRPQAKAVFMEVKVNDPGAAINSSQVESDVCFNDDMLNNLLEQTKTLTKSNYFENTNSKDSNNFHIQPIKGILKKQANVSQSSSKYFNEEAKFVRFQHNHNYYSKQQANNFKNIKTNRKCRIAPLL